MAPRRWTTNAMIAPTRRLLGVTAALLLLASACGDTGGVDSPKPSQNAEEGLSVTQVPPPAFAAGTLPDGPSALQRFEHDAFPAPTIDTSLIISGGPPPDGIPPIDRPKFLPVIDNLELLDAAEPVVALEIAGDARAYPVRILIWHEIVNDVVGGRSVAVTYCPLCNSAITYVREINGVETTFGTSGLLYLSALIMYDRATESLWTHFDGKAVAGLLTGSELEPIASPLLSWEDFRSTYPDGLVLDQSQTGYSRDYGRNPYVGYDDVGTSPFLYRGPLDDRAVAKERIVGIELNGETRAYLLSQISGDEATATNVRVGGQDVVIFWKPGQASALDSGRIAEGRDVGSVGVFLAEAEGGVLTFGGAGDRFTDEETASGWLITGEAVSGPLAGTTLERIPHLDTFWFAWATYRPETILVTDLLD